MIRSSRLVRDVCLGIALLAAAGCGGGKSSSTSSSSQARGRLRLREQQSQEGDGVRRQHHAGRPRAEAPGPSPHHQQQLPEPCSREACAASIPRGRVVNRGVGGEDTSGGRFAACPRFSAIDKSGFVLILEGTNDAHQCLDANVLVNNLRSMVQIAMARQDDPDHRDHPAELPEQSLRRRHHRPRSTSNPRPRVGREHRGRGDLRRHERPLSSSASAPIATRSTRTSRAIG